MHPLLEKLIKTISKLPGLGPRSARRVVLHLLKDKENHLSPLLTALQNAGENVQTCQECGNLDVASLCHICTDSRRDPHLLCVVEHVDDLWALERAGIFKGRYHVLGGVLSALDGIGPGELRMASLAARVGTTSPQEVILALNATIDGQTTSHYVMDLLKPYGVCLSRLAHGIPMGSELEYLDEGTLHLALQARTLVKNI